MKTTRRLSIVALACLSAVTIGLPAISASPAPAASPPGTVRVHGAYRNAEYGFRFAAPRGLKVFCAQAPAPNHGTVVTLGPERRVEVSAAFDAPEYGSTGALLTARLAQAVGATRRPASLGGRPAEEAAYLERGVVHVLVVRHEGGVDDGVNYTAELTSTPTFEPQDRATFRRLLATFRFVPRA